MFYVYEFFNSEILHPETKSKELLYSVLESIGSIADHESSSCTASNTKLVKVENFTRQMAIQNKKTITKSTKRDKVLTSTDYR